MKKLIPVLVVCIALAGCASQIMQGYVGKTVADAVMDYGAPETAFDISKHERAFVWKMRNSTIIPGSSNTYGNVTGYGNMAFYNAHTYTSPSFVSEGTCAYVLYAKRSRKDIQGPAAWTVTGFKKPRLDCE